MDEFWDFVWSLIDVLSLLDLGGKDDVTTEEEHDRSDT
jgi:hypothetical protein